MNKMKKIDTEEKTLEYLTQNPSGDTDDLGKDLSLEQINLMERSGFLEISLKKYNFKQEGIDYYVQEYALSKKPNFLGL